MTLNEAAIKCAYSNKYLLNEEWFDDINFKDNSVETIPTDSIPTSDDLTNGASLAEIAKQTLDNIQLINSTMSYVEGEDKEEIISLLQSLLVSEQENINKLQGILNYINNPADYEHPIDESIEDQPIKQYEIIGQKYSEEPSFYDWDKEHKFKNYEPVGEEQTFIVGPEENVRTLTDAENWFKKNHPELMMGGNIFRLNPSSDKEIEFHMFAVPSPEYPEGTYETQEARTNYFKNLPDFKPFPPIEEKYSHDQPLYVIRNKHGNQLSSPNPDDQELWDRIESRDPDGRRGLCVVAYTGKLNEDTVKIKDGKWANKGKEGTHGTFKTKKEADAQRKAMFAQGYKG